MKWYASDPWKRHKRSRRRRKGARQLSDVPFWSGWGRKPMWLAALAILLAVIGVGVIATPGQASVVLEADLDRISGEDPSAPGHVADGRGRLTDDQPPKLSVDLEEMDPTKFPAGNTCQTEIRAGAWTERGISIQFDGDTGTTFIDEDTTAHTVVAGDRAEVRIRCESNGQKHETQWQGVFAAPVGAEEEPPPPPDPLPQPEPIAGACVGLSDVDKGLDPDNFYPLWYRDCTGLALAQCLDVADPLCGPELALELEPAGCGPIDFPDAPGADFCFPLEFFWWTGEAAMGAPDGSSWLLVLAMEAAFDPEVIADGNQITFGRVRIRGFDLPCGTTYNIVHPLGVDRLTADVPAGELCGARMSEDIGCLAPCDFTAAFRSRVQFLTWDTFGLAPADGGPPEGYVGNPAIDHKVTRSPYGTNFFKVEGGGGYMVETDLFSIMGKIFTGVLPAEVPAPPGPFPPGEAPPEVEPPPGEPEPPADPCGDATVVTQMSTELSNLGPGDPSDPFAFGEFPAEPGEPFNGAAGAAIWRENDRLKVVIENLDLAKFPAGTVVHVSVDNSCAGGAAFEGDVPLEAIPFDGDETHLTGAVEVLFRGAETPPLELVRNATVEFTGPCFDPDPPDPDPDPNVDCIHWIGFLVP